MSRGFFTIAQNNELCDYSRLAYALALSLKATQKTESKLSIGVNKKSDVPEKYAKIFDEIIEIPWQDDSTDKSWKIHNEWKSFWMSPYDETIKLDADMLFLDDISSWWDILSTKNVFMTSKVVTYKGETITSDYYRKEMTSNNLPSVYTGCMFFNKSKEAKELFYMAGTIYKNWQAFFQRYMDDTRPQFVSTDVVFSLAIDLLDNKELFLDDKLDIPTFCHMKPYIQKTRKSLDNWMDELGVYFTPNLELFVGNFKQCYPFHYQRKEFLTNQIIEYYERYLGI